MALALDIPKYTMNEEEEKKEILRKYRALLRALKPKLKPGSKKQIRVAFEMAAERSCTCTSNVHVRDPACSAYSVCYLNIYS